MRVILIGGNKTTYFLARTFASKGYHLAIVNKDPAEAKWLSERVKALVILGDGSDPAILEQAGARRADVVISLTPHDEDNLITCQIARQMYGVPRTMALVNDPDNEAIFTQLGITTAFSATRIIATLIEQQTALEDITHLVLAAEGRVNVTEVTLRSGAPAIGKSLYELALPEDSLVACIIRGEQVIVPRGPSRLQLADRLILIDLPENHGQMLRALMGQTI